MNYIPRINQAITDAFRDGIDDPDTIRMQVKDYALSSDDSLYRQLGDYIDSAIELAFMIEEATKPTAICHQ